MTSTSPHTSDSYDEPSAENTPTTCSGRLRRRSKLCPGVMPRNRPAIALPTSTSLLPGAGARPLMIFASGRNANPLAGIPRISTFEAPDPSATSAVMTTTISPITPPLSPATSG
jgi:hypothetical protein